MNVHPIFIHFPIAFLSVYALCELLRFNIITRQPYWFYVKSLLVLLGVGSACFAIATGLLIEDAFASPLVHLHEYVNLSATGVFGIIALRYVGLWLQREKIKIPEVVKHIAQLPEIFVILLAAIGLLLITLGGALGGLIVYGADLDPATHLLYTILHGMKII